MKKKPFHKVVNLACELKKIHAALKFQASVNFILVTCKHLPGQTSMKKLLTIFAKNLVVDVQLGSKYVFVKITLY